MNRFTAQLAIAPFVAMFALPNSAFGNHSTTIANDGGGELISYAITVSRYKKQRRKIRFEGRCSSACTLFLSLPSSQTCIAPDAQFRFHAAYGTSPRGNRTATAYLMRNYPSWVRRWISTNGGLTSSIKTMPYKYAARYLRKCSLGH
jgi:hypothetical protein